MKPLIEFVLLNAGTSETSLTGEEVQIASALNEYALLFLDPKHDHDRLAGWILAKTSIESPLRCASYAGVGWDVSAGPLGGPRMVVMKRHYLYARKDVPHIAAQWELLWNRPTYREEYLMQLNPYLGEPDVLNYYITTDRPHRSEGFLMLNLHRDDLLVIRSQEDTETRVYRNGAVEHTSRPFDSNNALAVMLC